MSEVLELNPADWMTPAQAAERLGRSTEYLRLAAVAGKLDALMTPGGRMYRRTEIESLRESRTPTATPVQVADDDGEAD